MAKKYIITLTDEERDQLRALIKRGKTAAKTVTRAHALLQAADGATDAQIAAALQLGTATLERLRKRCVEEGVEAALHERPRPGGQRKLDGSAEATLVALACSTPPDGRPAWTMQLLADKLVELEVVDTVSDETVRRTLKKTNSSHGGKSNGVSRR
jgi:transposase